MEEERRSKWMKESKKEKNAESGNEMKYKIKEIVEEVRKQNEWEKKERWRWRNSKKRGCEKGKWKEERERRRKMGEKNEKSGIEWKWGSKVEKDVNQERKEKMEKIRKKREERKNKEKESEKKV